MKRERRGGPIAMSDDELAAFLAGAPSGAICVVDDDGHLLALPAQVVDFDDATLAVDVDVDVAVAVDVAVDVDGTEPDTSPRRRTPACVVADTFTAYRDIRGVIARGTVTWPPASHDEITMAVMATVTFSFANA